MNKEIVKIPKMEKTEYDQLIREEYVARIVFSGEKYPYIAPFIYVFDGNHMYFLSTRYGKKIENFKQNPYVSIEVEKYSPDMSNYAFITLSGRLVEVKDPDNKRDIRDSFIRMIKDKHLSKNIMIALGHSPQDPFEKIISEEQNLIWKLVDVNKSTGFKNGT
jgi:nitroimidazol reductase NimA-like FMN-containing flavoprotein (pyridoxamine 5'-phosphate oxidase superfamily)